jgi:hypothetical protein
MLMKLFLYRSHPEEKVNGFALPLALGETPPAVTDGTKV